MRGLLRWSYIGRKSGKITGIIRVLWSEFENAGLGKRIGVSGVAGIIKILIRSDLEDHQRLRSPVFGGEKLVHIQMSENRFCNKTTARDQDLRNRFARLACCIPNLDLEEFSAWAFFVNFINLVNGCRTNLQTVGDPWIMITPSAVFRPEKFSRGLAGFHFGRWLRMALLTPKLRDDIIADIQTASSCDRTVGWHTPN